MTFFRKKAGEANLSFKLRKKGLLMNFMLLHFHPAVLTLKKLMHLSCDLLFYSRSLKYRLI